jgi:hypothetical protein
LKEEISVREIQTTHWPVGSIRRVFILGPSHHQYLKGARGRGRGRVRGREPERASEREIVLSPQKKERGRGRYKRQREIERGYSIEAGSECYA